MNDPWATCNIFYGNARLNKDTLYHNTRSTIAADGSLIIVDDTYADVAKFHLWLIRLQTDFKSADIGLNPVRVGVFPGPVGTLNPMKVSIGRPGHFDFVQIADVATASAYVFSIVKPTVDKPIWTTYYGPLLIIFARCIHLAFAVPCPFADTIAGQGRVLPTDIPMMAEIMYLITDNPVLMLSTSMVNETAGIGAISRILGTRRANRKSTKFPPISARNLFRYMYLTLFRHNISSDAIMQPIQASLLAIFLLNAPPNDKVATPLGSQPGGFSFSALAKGQPFLLNSGLSADST
ncbi:hypothetical protein PSV09DRAFT_2256078 [Bipolaris maydis]|nr:hypothetical protein J3E74DRAFT_293744 [Bipolaris maydis]KAJ6212835.1 hypothetical protein PSV09DRAFT_2256078 [Bipolaris maydis]KAJ6280910.1 hypothetical protein J3E71DRAFT_241187 [Bipolaris maydis]